MSDDTRQGAYHYSELAAARRCPMKHHYSYVREGGLRAKREALNLKRGLWLHACLQADALKRGLEHGSLLEVPEWIDVPGLDESVRIAVGTESASMLYGQIDPDVDDGEEGFEFVYPLSWKGMLDLLQYHTDYAMLPEDVIEERYTQGGQDLPTACRNIIRGYLWQYRDVLPLRKPLLVEVAWARTLKDLGPVDVEMEGRADLVEIDERDVVTLTDWKSTLGIPGQEYKLMEAQRWIYLWGLEQKLASYGMRVQALALDYLVTSTPTVPKQNQPKKIPKTKSKCKDCDGSGWSRAPEPVGVDAEEIHGHEDPGEGCPACEGVGKRINTPTANEQKGEFSTAKIKTTPLVYFETLKEAGLELTDHHRETINELERENSFYRRYVMPVNQKVLVTVLRETAQAAQATETFRNTPGLAYRNVDRSCTFACDFTDLCSAELYGQDATTVRERFYEPRHPAEIQE